MLAESRKLIDVYHHYFKRLPRNLYWLVIVNNHFNDKYYFFLYNLKIGTELLHSHELLALVHDEAKYKQVLADLKAESNLRIEYRDTSHLVEPTAEITTDKVHGHNY